MLNQGFETIKLRRELPILFNTDMVTAVIDGSKIVTRRLIKPQNRNICIPPIHEGDYLYVRETWSFLECITCPRDYRLSGPSNCYDYLSVEYNDGDSVSEGCFIYRAGFANPERITWHPSIHMPKVAVRIWLKVTGVRAEGLQSMSLDDFLHEGVVLHPEAYNDPENAYRQAREQFIRIWDSIALKSKQSQYVWKNNPLVWVIEFERCNKPSGAGQ